MRSADQFALSVLHIVLLSSLCAGPPVKFAAVIMPGDDKPYQLAVPTGPKLLADQQHQQFMNKIALWTKDFSALQELVDKKAGSKNLVERSEAIADIRAALEWCHQTENSELWNKFINAKVMFPLRMCLSADGKVNKHPNIPQNPPLPIEIVLNAARAIEIIAAQNAKEAGKWNVEEPIYEWLGNPEYAGVELIKRLLAIIGHLAEGKEIFELEEPEKYKSARLLVPLMQSQNEEIAREAARVRDLILANA